MHLPRCITGEPTPKVDVNVDILNFGPLQLGDLIGRPLDSGGPDMFFKTQSLLEYDASMVHNKEINIQKTERAFDSKLDNTNVVLLTNNSLNNFDIYVDTKLKEEL